MQLHFSRYAIALITYYKAKMKHFKKFLRDQRTFLSSYTFCSYLFKKCHPFSTDVLFTWKLLFTSFLYEVKSFKQVFRSGCVLLTSTTLQLNSSFLSPQVYIKKTYLSFGLVFPSCILILTCGKNKFYKIKHFFTIKDEMHIMAKVIQSLFLRSS